SPPADSGRQSPHVHAHPRRLPTDSRAPPTNRRACPAHRRAEKRLPRRVGQWYWVRPQVIRSKLLLDPVQKFGVRLGVDFPAQDLLRPGHRERRDLRAQLLARALRFLLDVGLGGGLFAITFRLGCRFCLLDDLRTALLGLRHDLGRARARFLNRPLGLPARLFERLPALLAGGEALVNLLLARLDGAQQRRPDELDREPDEQRESDRLRY